MSTNPRPDDDLEPTLPGPGDEPDPTPTPAPDRGPEPEDVPNESGMTPSQLRSFGQYFLDLSAAAPASVPTVPAANGVAHHGAVDAASGGGATHAAASAPKPPDPFIEERTTLKLINLEVLGHYANQSIEVFSLTNREVHRIENISRFSYRNLLAICGEDARDKVHPGREAIHGKKTLDEVADAIALLAGKVRLDENPPRGQGVWKAPGGRLVIVNGPAGGLYTPGGALDDLATPRAGKQLLDFSASEPWVDFDKLRPFLRMTDTAGWSAGVLAEARRLFENWYFAHPGGGKLTTALAAASFVQAAWSWRPVVGVTGPSDAGKSSLFEALRKVFGEDDDGSGGLAECVEKPTEAAVRQQVKNRSCVLMIDEFENDAHRPRILELFRTTSKGGYIVRGTSDQRGRKYGLRHIPWVAAIELGLTREADRNRFIILDLALPPADRRGDLRLPGDDALRDLGLRLLAVALRHAHEANKMALRIKTHRVQGVPGRVVESYATPAALWATAHGLGDDGGRAVIGEFLGGRDFDGQMIADEKALLRDLLAAHVDRIPVANGDRDASTRYTVGKIATDQTAYQRGADELESHGIALVGPHKGPRPSSVAGWTHLFVGVREVQLHLLRGNRRWEDSDLAELLLRLPKAVRSQRRLNNTRPWGVLVPREAAGLDGEPEAAGPEPVGGEPTLDGVPDAGRPAAPPPTLGNEPADLYKSVGPLNSEYD